MIRTLLWIMGGVILGLIIHIVVILAMPSLAPLDLWGRISALGPEDNLIVLDPLAPGDPNPLGLDPTLAYAICRMDLRTGPGEVSGTLPEDFWSLSVFDKSGVAIYSTTNRSGTGQFLNLGLFDPAQTRLLAEQQINIDDGLLIVETKGDDVFVVIRLAPPHHEVLPRYRQMLSTLNCGTIRTE